MPDVYRNKVYDLGAWRNVTAQYVKVAGSWVAVTKMYVKVNGTWKTSYPFPLSADTTLSSLTVNGSDVLSTLAFAAPNGTTSVTVAATATNSASTITGLGSRSVSLAGNPNNLNVVVTAEDGVTTRTYTIVVTVAPPATVTIYWAYCSSGGYQPTQTGNATITGTSDPTEACNNKKAELGNPPNWVCQGTSAPTAPSCTPIPPSPCCTISYQTYDGSTTGGGVKTCYYTNYYTDPCAGTTCAPYSYTFTTSIGASCPSA
jgi:hypothetical protein